MKKLSFKLITAVSVGILLTVMVQLSVFATNENVEIVKKSETDYMIYVNNNMDADFEFAFSNDKDTELENLNYIESAKDSLKDDANRIAYVNKSTIGLFDADTYMWVKKSNELVLEGVKIDLSDSITEAELNLAANISKAIKVDLTQTTEREEIKNEIKYTTTLGKVVMLENGSYNYQMVKATDSEDYSNFMKMANKVSKANSITSYYDKVQLYGEFYNLYNKLKTQLADNAWVKVEGNEILQPEDAVDGEEYILWISDEDSKLVDVQFLSSKKEMSQEKVVEKITTKLPVTYDNNTLLIVLGVLVVVAIIVTVRIIMIKKSEQE